MHPHAERQWDGREEAMALSAAGDVAFPVKEERRDDPPAAFEQLLGQEWGWSCTVPEMAAGILKDFLLWIKENLGAWGPLVLALAYIPLTVLAVPASILTLGGGYLFGLPVGFVADSIGATIGATAAFLLGRTIGRPYVLSKCKDYPKFQAVAIAIQRSGFKIVLLLRLVPLLPFNMLNYLLSVTPVGIVEYMLASWLGMMPITLALVYVGTTLKDLSDVTHGWSEISTTRWNDMAVVVHMHLGKIDPRTIYHSKFEE
ncbi:hypothetical protein TRIUR3_20457 [Triticum urartu]|uniref:VTT domain-containing protein n=1 Tax=Triticum urartu TaxID=4572 RepID=M8A7Y5_TRIUA|nr:hypothetical protein TRIUR3_20457 [Triticum urartu]